ncbi:MAG: helix-hairpin-helix domain-containing protein, partial [Candidatus Methylomirabilales bacterium]
GQRGVINISWSTNGEHIGIREALIDADRKGLAIVASGGNYGISEIQVADKPHYPSGYAFLPGDTEVDVAGRRKIRGLCSVAALNSSKVKASYSYFGARSVTVSAPGGEPGLAGIGIFLASTPANYDYGAGTSFASPHVSGLIALLLSLDPNLKVQRAIEILRETATDIDVQNPGFVGMLGAGLINARRALESRGPGASRGAVTSDTERSTTTPINVNTATFEELVALPLLGPWSAARIIAYRGQHGPFATIWDLTLTGAIDTWTIQQIQDLITAGAVSVPNVPTPAAEPSPTPGADSRLNINTATFEELVALPLLGPWSAARIIAYRGQHGPFASIGDLTLTGAVDAWTVQHLKPLITAY